MNIDIYVDRDTDVDKCVYGYTHNFFSMYQAPWTYNYSIFIGLWVRWGSYSYFIVKETEVHWNRIICLQSHRHEVRDTGLKGVCFTQKPCSFYCTLLLPTNAMKENPHCDGDWLLLFPELILPFFLLVIELTTRPLPPPVSAEHAASQLQLTHVSKLALQQAVTLGFTSPQ